MVPAMNCQDVRKCFSVLVDGQLGLTEWALVEAHLGRCAECGQELERLRRGAARRARRARIRVTAAVLVVTAAVVVGGLAIFQIEWRPWSGQEAVRPATITAPPRTEAPPAPAPARPLPPPAARPKAKEEIPKAERMPAGSVSGPAVSIPPPAPVAPPTGERMPTQAASPALPPAQFATPSPVAAPGERMPSQGSPPTSRPNRARQ